MERFHVSLRRPKATTLLIGPFETRADALRYVEAARILAAHLDYEGDIDIVSGGIGSGAFNEALGLSLEGGGVAR
jgi:hypothetical protein